mmetsp:Transcript_25976/g.56618  ORF Transcript_25976/g.56618 Transcript_25976/m.56618 type:complete len:354 (-) Transcript_25976:777-1838(-)|eukprot:CAMPEP_0202893344 /NCGR_PEP_ID=MMETSP1392-20130828/2947_1 /ASSEMBLY_ACC=CAM_ASM_000868 /TAXON_ID=225041 /ORGANISM="Chlamydomonas chlamydogama, Strain SAG 11-48b" /LENGTH=353 /DNA_ID=CAMNT_0049577645 /DNA_START=253 /DNA_END=1314 /DNA_ORIENTATION=-
MSKRHGEQLDPGASKSQRFEASNGIKEEDVKHGTVRVPRRDGAGKYPIIIYREGEPLPGLVDLYKTAGPDTIVEVVINADHIHKDNRRVKARQIWGDLIYTPDSDVVAVLMHMGYYAYYLGHPPPAVLDFRVLLRLLPPQEKYTSKARFVKSRAWCSSNEGCSFKVEQCIITTRSGTQLDLQPCVDEVPAPYPSVQPGSLDRQITTRNTKGKVSQEVSIQFNLCNEPWLKYTLSAISDKGLKASQWTCARLHEEVLFLETHTERFQICFTTEATDETGRPKDLFMLARCKAPLPTGLLLKMGVPMPADLVDMLESNLSWEDFKWGVTTLHVRGLEMPVKRMHFIPIAKPPEAL